MFSLTVSSDDAHYLGLVAVVAGVMLKGDANGAADLADAADVFLGNLESYSFRLESGSFHEEQLDVIAQYLRRTADVIEKNGVQGRERRGR